MSLGPQIRNFKDLEMVRGKRQERKSFTTMDQSSRARVPLRLDLQPLDAAGP